MRCHQCNQDSVRVVMDDDGTYIRCDICNLNIHCINEELSDLFLYNKELEEAEQIGRIAYGNGDNIESNPYDLHSDEIILYKRWEYGHKSEQESYELSALSLSSEKIKNELKNVQAQKEEIEGKLTVFIPTNYLRIKNFCDKLLGTKVLGRFLGKKVDLFKVEYKEFYKDCWDYTDSDD